MQLYERGPAVSDKAGELSKEVLMELHRFYNAGPLIRVCFALDRNPPEGSVILSSKAKFYQHITLNGRRITPISRSRRASAGSSIVRAHWNDCIYAGEVLAAFDHVQAGFPAEGSPPLFVHMRWMKRVEDTVFEEDYWAGL